MIEYRGWTLVGDEQQDGEGWWYEEYYAVRSEERVYLHASRYKLLFSPSVERFAYLVDHGFPKPPKGHWNNRELDELIMEETANGRTFSKLSRAPQVVQYQDRQSELVRHLWDRAQARSGGSRLMRSPR